MPVETPLAPSAELAERVQSLYAAMSRGDAGAVEAAYSLAPRSVFVGTSESEFWTDSVQHNVDVRKYWQPGTLRIVAGALHAVSLGDVGFTIDRPTMTWKDGTTLKLRVTLVRRREGGTFKVVHSHASVGGA